MWGRRREASEEPNDRAAAPSPPRLRPTHGGQPAPGSGRVHTGAHQAVQHSLIGSSLARHTLNLLQPARVGERGSGAATAWVRVPHTAAWQAALPGKKDGTGRAVASWAALAPRSLVLNLRLLQVLEPPHVGAPLLLRLGLPRRLLRALPPPPVILLADSALHLLRRGRGCVCVGGGQAGEEGEAGERRMVAELRPSSASSGRASRLPAKARRCRRFQLPPSARCGGRWRCVPRLAPQIGSCRHAQSSLERTRKEGAECWRVGDGARQPPAAAARRQAAAAHIHTQAHAGSVGTHPPAP